MARHLPPFWRFPFRRFPFWCFSLGLVVGALGCGKHQAGVEGRSSTDAVSSPMLATGGTSANWSTELRETALREGREVLTRHQCNRCHVVEGLKEVAQPLHCVSCHTFLTGLRPTDDAFQKITKKYGRGILDRYQHNIVHLLEVPTLTAIARRVRPEWIATFLQSPFDVRPMLEESMIRHTLSETDIRKIVRGFAAEGDAPDPYAPNFSPPKLTKPEPELLLAGRGLFLERGCPTCHTFGNVPTGVRRVDLMGQGLSAQLAPNLRFVRDRTRVEVLVPWILEPSKIRPGTKMPPFVGTPREAFAIASWLLHGDPEIRPVPAELSVPAPAILTRTVTYEEMKLRTLGKVCVHCHMNDHEKDPGPGNLGGLGYKGIGLRMRTYETLVSGMMDKKTGTRVSALVPRPGEPLPLILMSMARRRQEHQRDQVAPFADHERPAFSDPNPGMPLGLPALSDEESSILATWIAQGCKGPSATSGIAGVTDGLLVPDGAIEKNEGCELRMPSEKRPEWAAK